MIEKQPEEATSDEKYTIKFMKRRHKTPLFYWPDKVDADQLSASEILCLLAAPEPKSNRGDFTFPADVMKKADLLLSRVIQQ